MICNLLIEFPSYFLLRHEAETEDIKIRHNSC